MSLTSPLFLPFLALVAWLAFAGRRWGRASLGVLAGASLLFYATWNPAYCLALVGTATVDWWVGRRLGLVRAPATRRWLLVASLAYNLGTLAVFKYFNLLADSATRLAAHLGGELNVPLHIVFAVGISFYTFQSLSYVVDVYRDDQPPCQSWLAYLSFVSFFPTLLSGPISRAETLLPQLERRPSGLDEQQASEGFFLIASGFLKKGAADYLAINLVNRVFDLPAMFSSAEVLAGIYGYAVQIYLDFSGYSDLAIGAALLLGIRLKDNFNCPYRAVDLADFWRRWHISFSTWLRDYLFFALPGKRAGTPWPYLNLVITFALGGLWHGGSWSYLAWGTLHGLGLAVVRLAGARTTSPPWWRQAAGAALTFHFVAFGWLLFRCADLHAVTDVLAVLGRCSRGVGNVPRGAGALLLVVLAAQWVPDRLLDRVRHEFAAMPALAQAACLVAVFVGLRQLAGTAPAPFIYFGY